MSHKRITHPWNPKRDPLTYVDRHFLVNAVCSIWDSEVRRYAWKRGQIHVSVMHFITWIGPIVSGIVF